MVVRRLWNQKELRLQGLLGANGRRWFRPRDSKLHCKSVGIGSGRWSHRSEPTAWLESLLGTTAIGIIRTWLITSVLSLSFASLSQAATATFSGRGNEPNWRAEVTDATIIFQAMGAEAVTISPKPKATVVADAETYLAMVEGEPFSLKITDKICVDSMSGMTYPKTVAVNLGLRVFDGG